MKEHLADTGIGKPVIIVPMNMKWRCHGLFKWIKRLFTPAPRHGMITRTCRNCGRTFSLPEDVQYWPDYCLECRQKAPEQTITRKCRGCGKMFSFSSTAKRWPNYCRECQAGRKAQQQKNGTVNKKGLGRRNIGPKRCLIVERGLFLQGK